MAKYHVDIDKSIFGASTRFDFECFFDDIKNLAFPDDLHRQRELFQTILTVHSEEELKLGLDGFLKRTFVNEEMLDQKLNERPWFISRILGAKQPYTQDWEVPYPLPHCQRQHDIVLNTVEQIIKYCYKEKIDNDACVLVPHYRILREELKTLKTTNENVARIQEIEEEMRGYRNQISTEIKNIANSMLEALIQTITQRIEWTEMDRKNQEQSEKLAKALQQQELEERQDYEETQNLLFLLSNPNIIETDEEKHALLSHPIKASRKHEDKKTPQSGGLLDILKSKAEAEADNINPDRIVRRDSHVVQGYPLPKQPNLALVPYPLRLRPFHPAIPFFPSAWSSSSFYSSYPFMYLPLVSPAQVPIPSFFPPHSQHKAEEGETQPSGLHQEAERERRTQKNLQEFHSK